MHGESEYEWHTVADMLIALSDSAEKGTARSVVEEFTEGRMFQLMQQRLRGNFHRLPLLQVLVQNRTTLCWDLKDKIYAILSLASETSMTVDYSRPKEQIFCDVLETCGPAVQPCDIVRYAALVKEALWITMAPAGIDPMYLSRTQRLTNVKNNALLNIEGFITGSIAHSSNIHKLREFAQREYLLTRETSTCRHQIGFLRMPYIDSPKLDKMQVWDIINKLEDLDLRRLEVDASVLNNMTSWLNITAVIRSLDNPKAFSLVIIDFHQNLEAQTALELTWGSVRPNDQILQFYGFDRAHASEKTALARRFLVVCLSTWIQQALGPILSPVKNSSTVACNYLSLLRSRLLGFMSR